MVARVRLENLVPKGQRENLAHHHRITLRTKAVQAVLVVRQAVPALAQKRERAFLKGSRQSMLELQRRPTDQRILPQKATNLLPGRSKLTTQNHLHFPHSKTINHHSQKDRKLKQVLPPLNRAVLHWAEASKPLPHFRCFGNREINAIGVIGLVVCICSKSLLF